jgi:hypothetical protein
MFVEKISTHRTLLLVLLFAFCAISNPQNLAAAWNTPKKVTIMCYMNGDNNLANEVLHAVDMMETIGSSENVDIIALVDGMPGDNGGYGPQWESTRLLHITKDNEVGVINSPVLEELGEKNLGDPQVLENFIKKCQRYPSEKYFFIVFAHGRGIIDTKSFSAQKNYKSVLLSPDETGERAMSHQEFRQAVKKSMAGRKFDLMLFFSCLTNMVEVGHGLQEITRYMIGSEDEIRIVNEPLGTYQIRGIEPEKLIGEITSNVHARVLDLGKVTIDSFISQYADDGGDQELTAKYPASLALVDCSKYDKLAKSLDLLAKTLVDKMQDGASGKAVLRGVHVALTASQNYPSFLNLEYFDLKDLLLNLSAYSEDAEIKELCQNSIDILTSELILYERHTNNSNSNGVSIFLPIFQIPENIYQSHLTMYEESSFSKDTAWVLLINEYRTKMLDRYTEILVDEYEKAYLNADVELINRLDSKISWALREDAVNGKYSEIKRYLEIVNNMETSRVPTQFLLFLQDALKLHDNQQQVVRNSDNDDNLLKTVEVLLISKGDTIPDA